jgi:hypothetical protein
MNEKPLNHTPIDEETLRAKAEEIKKFAELVAENEDQYISTSAFFASAQAVGGTFGLYSGALPNSTQYIFGAVGGLAAGLNFGGGKLTLDKRINQKGYTGSCSVFMLYIFAGYTNVIGYDQNSKAVLWFNGGGAGFNIFTGGGRFEVVNPIS